MNQKFKAVLDLICEIYLIPVNLMLRVLTTSAQQMNFRAELLKHLYNKDVYGVVSFYPKSTDSFQVRATDQGFDDVAIILQGPVTIQDHFTLNTVKMYKQFYKNVNVIVSTWADAPEEEVAALHAAGATVILNEYPAENYEGNLNMQLTSSLAGVRKAKELGLSYACKTRTDQRYYNPCALSLLLGRHEPGKITLLSWDNSYAKYPFWLSDFFSFGEVDRLKELYSCRFDTADDVKRRKEIRQSQAYQEFLDFTKRAELDCRIKVPSKYDYIPVEFSCAEIKIAYEYFCRKEDRSKYNDLQDAYEDFLYKHIIMADVNSLGFYWFKRRNKAFVPGYFHQCGKLDMARHMAIREERREA